MGAVEHIRIKVKDVEYVCYLEQSVPCVEIRRVQAPVYVARSSDCEDWYVFTADDSNIYTGDKWHQVVEEQIAKLLYWKESTESDMYEKTS